MSERSPLKDRELASYRVRANWRERAEKHGIDPYTIGHLMKFAHRHASKIDQVDTAIRNTANHPFLSRLRRYARSFSNSATHKPFEQCLDEKDSIDYSTGKEPIEQILFSEKDQFSEKQWGDITGAVNILYSESNKY